MGFTLVELMVVIAIITILTAIFLFQQSRFNSSTLLRSLAYSVALSIRQAQVYGISVREASIGSSNFSAYGVYLTPGAPATSYTLFADANNNGVYDAGDVDIKTFTVGSGYSISKFCGVISTTPLVASCSDGGVGGGGVVTRLVIYFKRPNSDALFSSSVTGETYASAYVQVKSAIGDTRNITVSASGQIVVCSPNMVYPACL